jgi:hypothetical protein
MAYSDFTASELTKKFGVRFKAAPLFPDVKKIEPTEWLTNTLDIGQHMGFSTEKSRSERLVSPVLAELNRNNNYSFHIYSGVNLDAEPEAGLRGECDFLFSRSRIQDFVTAPLFCVTEAKRQDLELGTVQVAAQLIGMRKFNQDEGIESSPVLFGASTTGVEWRFIRFDGSTFTIDEKRYLLSDLSTILGILQSIVDN